MRKTFHNEFKLFFRSELLNNRQLKNLTQKQMAELLDMSERAYAELECGRSSCSISTLLMFLVTCESPQTFLEKINHIFKRLLVSKTL